MVIGRVIKSFSYMARRISLRDYTQVYGAYQKFEKFEKVKHEWNCCSI